MWDDAGMMRPSRSSRRFRAAALLAIVLLAALIVSVVFSKTRAPLAYTQAQISVPQSLPEEPGVLGIAGRTITIDDPEQVRRLVEFFPGLDRGRRSNFGTRGWIAPIQITLTRPDGSTHSFETNFAYWTEGRGDHYAKPGLEDFLRALFPPQQPSEQVSETKLPDLRDIAHLPAWLERRFPPEVYGQPTLTADERDLDGDGVPDLIVSTTAGVGNAGQPHFLFKRIHAGYVLLGEIFMHPLAYRVLPPTDDGRVRLVMYHRTSASEGHIHWLIHGEDGFSRWHTEQIHPGDGGTDEGRRRYQQHFGREVTDEELAHLMPPADLR
jgi:hypothetical protein